MDLIERFRAWRRENPDSSIKSFRRGFDPVESRRKGPPRGEDLTIERGRFVFVVSIKDDETSDTEDTGFWGSFVDEREFPENLKRRVHVRRNEHGYWRPQHGSDVRTVAAFNHEAGMSKAEAYRRALESAYEQMERLENYGDGWHFVGVAVTAYAVTDEDRETELADASLWGVESDSDRSYFNWIISDLIDQCEKSIASDEVKAAERAESRRVTGIW